MEVPSSIVMVDKARKFPPGCGPNVSRTGAAFKSLLERSDYRNFVGSETVKVARDAAVAQPVNRRTSQNPEEERSSRQCHSDDYHSNHGQGVVFQPKAKLSELDCEDTTAVLPEHGGGIISNSHPVKNSRPQIDTRGGQILLERGGGHSGKQVGANLAKSHASSASVSKEGSNSSSKIVLQQQRNTVKENLRLFRHKCSDQSRGSNRECRPDMAAWKDLKREGRITESPKMIGSVPGVEVGDEFTYRVELVIIGLHSHLVRGIDFKKYHGQKVATCVVASEGYMDKMKSADVMTYVGEGGLVNKNLSDQKLIGGNLALRNSWKLKVPVRVVRGVKRGVSRVSYIYYGLYSVSNYERKKSAQGNRVYEFELRRLPDQPPVDGRKQYLRW